ncbi:MAG: hypothetical protein H7Y38_14170, partial [Armatimonadetes bacterium]|nr:hypothetical protein [Armatimonadota bacterium]
ELFDGAGNALPNFSIASGSGTLYTAAGVQTVVPESNTLFLVFAVAVAISAASLLSPRSKTAPV